MTMENKGRSNFALMDEMEESEMLNSHGMGYIEKCSKPAAYEGRVYELLRKVGLTPLLALGLVLMIPCLFLPPIFLVTFGFGAVILIFGIVEKIIIDRSEKRKNNRFP